MITNGKWLGLCALVISVLPRVAFAAEDGGDNSMLIIGGIILGWILSGALVFVNSRIGLMVTAVLAIGVSAYLGQQHFSDAPAICDVGATFSCSDVNQSVFSTIGPIPIAFIGMGYYLGMLLLAFSSEEEGYEAAGSFLTITGAFSVLVSLALMYISAFEIEKWCLFCVALYGLNLTSFVGALQLKKKQNSSLGALAGKSLSTAAGALVATVIVTTFAFSDSGETSGSKGEVVDVMTMVELVEGELTLDGSEPVLGDVTAPVQLVEFADFECPHCASTAPKIKGLIERNAKVNLRFKQYPISNKCNPSVQALAHENACEAAAATECAHLQGKFWEMNRIVFKNQNYLSPTDIEFLAEQIGLDLAQFKTCMNDEAIAKGIAADIASAQTAGVTGTPSIYIKGIGDKTRWYKLGRYHTVEDLEGALTGLVTK